jgi:hypothetical protein
LTNSTHAQDVQPASRNWEADAAQAGKIHNATGRNLWHVAFLVAVNTQPSKGGRPAKETATEGSSKRVSFRQFAEVAGITDVTVGRYYATWEKAADRGLVPHARDLTVTEPKSAIAKLSTEDWGESYPSREVTGPAPAAKASGAASARRNRSPAKADDTRGGQDTTSREPEPSTIMVRPDQVVSGNDSPMVRYVKYARIESEKILGELKANIPLDAPMMGELAEFLNTVHEIEHLVQVRLDMQK